MTHSHEDYQKIPASLISTQLRSQMSLRPLAEIEEANFQLRLLLLELQQGKSPQDEALYTKFPKLHNLTPQQGRIFWLLFHANGRPLLKQTLFNALYYERPNQADEPNIKVIDVYIYHVRRQLQVNDLPFTIHTIWGSGYALTPQGSDIYKDNGLITHFVKKKTQP